jgi:hypothetical protein
MISCQAIVGRCLPCNLSVRAFALLGTRGQQLRAFAYSSRYTLHYLSANRLSDYVSVYKTVGTIMATQKSRKEKDKRALVGNLRGLNSQGNSEEKELAHTSCHT